MSRLLNTTGKGLFALKQRAVENCTRAGLAAVRQAQKFVKSGHRWVVDMDLEKFFDFLSRLNPNEKERGYVRKPN